MTFNQIPLLERQERARRVDYAMRDDITGINIGFFSQDSLKNDSDNVKKRIYKGLFKPSRLSACLRAAMIIRRNFQQWQKFISKPDEPPPLVFKSFAEDRLIVFYLFFCDRIKLFHLNPLYPFLICKQINVKAFLTQGEAGNNLEVIKSVVEMYFHLGSPWSGSMFHIEFTGMANALKDPKGLQGRWKFFSLGPYFHGLRHLALGFTFLHDNKGSEHIDSIAINMHEFVIELSTAISFDKPGSNTLEVIHELFPQFPELVGSVSRKYYLSIIDKIPTREVKFSSFKLAREVLEEKFDCRINYADAHQDTTLLNSSILSMIRSHPELFVRWATDPQMYKLYRKLVDPVSLYD